MEKFLNHAVVQVHPCINALCDNTKGIEASLIPQIIVSDLQPGVLSALSEL